MAWRRPGHKPFSEPMMVTSLTRICVARPQWDIPVKTPIFALHIYSTFVEIHICLCPPLRLCGFLECLAVLQLIWLPFLCRKHCQKTLPLWTQTKGIRCNPGQKLWFDASLYWKVPKKPNIFSSEFIQFSMWWACSGFLATFETYNTD